RGPPCQSHGSGNAFLYFAWLLVITPVWSHGATESDRLSRFGSTPPTLMTGEVTVGQGHRATRRSWDLRFTALPEEVARLRRAVRAHLVAWGLDELVDTAQLCVSELVSNIVTHVGIGSPGSLVLSAEGGRLRVAVHDPDTPALLTSVDARGH